VATQTPIGHSPQTGSSRLDAGSVLKSVEAGGHALGCRNVGRRPARKARG